MAKYIIASRLAGRRTAGQRAAARGKFDESVASILSEASRLSILGERAPTRESRRILVLESDPGEMDKLKAKSPADVLIEEAIEYRKLEQAPFDLLRAAPLDLADMLRAEALDAPAAGTGQDLRVEVSGRQGRSNVPLHGAEVHAFLSGPPGVRDHMVGRTNAEGKVNFEFAAFYEIRAVLIVPYSGFWPKVVRGGTARRILRVTCDALPTEGPGGWWHDVMNVRPNAGNGKFVHTEIPIRIGVIDSGCGPNPSLDHVRNEGAFINGERDPQGGQDSGSHGTHVAGIIGANTLNVGVPFQGIAPAADLFVARVFPPTGSANQGDIADALDHLVEERKVHLVNMSLGASQSSAILLDSIRAAYEQGVLCICAAGNESGSVLYPAAFEETVAVSALGRAGEVPLDSLPALPHQEDRYGVDQLYLADFSNFGNEIDLASPGVGIIAPVPSRFGHDDAFAAMNGTSMASPAACGALAVLLAGDRHYEELSPSQHRSRYAKQVLTVNCHSKLGDRRLEGRGLLTLP